MAFINRPIHIHTIRGSFRAFIPTGSDSQDWFCILTCKWWAYLMPSLHNWICFESISWVNFKKCSIHGWCLLHARGLFVLLPRGALPLVYAIGSPSSSSPPSISWLTTSMVFRLIFSQIVVYWARLLLLWGCWICLPVRAGYSYFTTQNWESLWWIQLRVFRGCYIMCGFSLTLDC